MTLGLLGAGAWFLHKQRQDTKNASRANFKGPSGTTWQTLKDNGWFGMRASDPTFEVYFPLPTTDVRTYPLILTYRGKPGARQLVSLTQDPKYKELGKLALRDFAVSGGKVGYYLSY